MDLAEIRKKARPGRTGSWPSPGRPAPSVQGAPERTAAPPPAAAAVAPATEPAPPDPLEALFAFRPASELAAEESYQQGLRREEQEKDLDLRQWLTFSLGREEYALDIAQVGEIIKPREITDIPRVPDFILGIISLRGIIVPVFDLQRRLRLGTAELSPASRIIVCQHGERTVGLLVDGITQVVRVPAQGIEPPPAVLTGLDRELVAGVGRLQGRMMILLHLPSVLDVSLV